MVNTGQAAIDAALNGLGIVRVVSYQIDALVRAKRLRIVLADHDAEPIPVHLVQLPGVQARPATAFADFALPRIRQAIWSKASPVRST
jgi:DNA-binding transcriptional LysR family regulator